MAAGDLVKVVPRNVWTSQVSVCSFEAAPLTDHRTCLDFRAALVLQAAAVHNDLVAECLGRRLFVERVAECTFTAHAFLGAPLYHRNQKLLLRNAAGDS